MYEKELNELRESIIGKLKEIKGDMVTQEQLEQEIEKFKASHANTDANVELKEQIQKFEEAQENLREIVQANAASIDKMSAGPSPASRGKNPIRKALEDYFQNLKVTKEEFTDKNGNTRIAITLPDPRMSQKMVQGDIVFDKETIEKAGEDMFLNGTAGQQSIFNQAINRDYIGDQLIPSPVPIHAIDVIPSAPTTGSNITILVYENYEETIDFVAEGAAASASSRVERNSKDRKVLTVRADADFTKELLEDQDELITELEKLLLEGLKVAIDKVIFTTGGDNSSTPYGMFNSTYNCTVFNPLQYEGTEPNASAAHVAKRAKQYARKYSSTYNPDRGYNPNVVFLSDGVKLDIESLENTDTDSRNLRWMVFSDEGELSRIAGMGVIDNPQISDNELIVATSDQHTIRVRKDATMEMGYVDDNMKKGIVTMVLNFRMAYGVKDPAANVYVDDIVDAIDILSASAAESLVRVQGYATGSDASALTVATLTNTGATDVIAANLSAYKTAIAAEASIADLAALQTVIDTVNAA